MLLGNIKLAETEHKQIADQLFSTQIEDDFAFKSNIVAQKSLDKQTLFREREVDSLKDLIYGNQETADEDDELEYDTLRFDVN